MSRGRNFTSDEVPFTTHYTAGTEIGIAHSLTVDGKPIVPRAWRILRQNKAGSLYPGTSAWTTSTVYFRSDVSALAGVLLLF